jgi:hypothetical protein
VANATTKLMVSDQAATLVAGSASVVWDGITVLKVFSSHRRFAPTGSASHDRVTDTSIHQGDVLPAAIRLVKQELASAR